MTLGTQIVTEPNDLTYFDIAAAINNMDRRCFSSIKTGTALKVDNEATSILNPKSTTTSGVFPRKKRWVPTKEEREIADKRFDEIWTFFNSPRTEERKVPYES